MSIKLLFLIILFISQNLLIFSSSEEPDPVTDPLIDSEPQPVHKPKTWSVMKLYKYLNETYLHRNNPNYDENIRYMIFDPENYCKYEDFEEGFYYLKLLSDKYNVSSYIFFISYMKDKHKNESEEVYDIYIDKLNYLIYRDHKDYDENMTMTVCFFIKDKKMRIRTPDGLKKIYTNSETFNILNRRKKDLQKNNYKEVAIGVAKDLYKTYTKKTEDANANIVLIFTVIFIIGITMVVFLLTRSQLSEQEDKVRFYLEKLKKSNNAKEFLTESCIFCLEKFKLTQESKKNEESEKKELLRKDEISTLGCGHKFHRNCIADWNKKEQNCPFCKIKLDIIGNENANKLTSLNFSIILNEILRIQANKNLLNINEIGRIRRIYYPQQNINKKKSSTSTFH